MGQGWNPEFLTNMTSQNYHNFGIAGVKVRLGDGLPYINTNPVRVNFDISASSYEIIMNSPLLPPLLTEQAMDSGDTFSAMFPSKRKYYIDNFLSQSSEETEYKKKGLARDQEGKDIDVENAAWLNWKPTEAKDGRIKTIFEEGKFTNAPNEYEKYSSMEYEGPYWTTISEEYEPPPNDSLIIKNYFEWIQGEEELDEGTTENTGLPIPKTMWVSQRKTVDGLFWGIESCPFLSENMPFWINIKRPEPPPSEYKHDTMYVISLGLEDQKNSFDIVIGNNRRPHIIDYVKGRQNSKEFILREWDADLSRLFTKEDFIEIGVMTIAGHLVISVNKDILTYKRIDRTESADSKDNSGTMAECKIAKGKIRIYGTNIASTINVCPMFFAPLSLSALPIPTTNNLKDGDSEVTYKGVDFDGNPSGSVCELPTPPSIKQKLYGVDCDFFYGDGGDRRPKGFGFHRQGKVWFSKAEESGIPFLPSQKTNFYVLAMKPYNLIMTNADGTEVVIKRAGTPYFFRLKGTADVTKNIRSPNWVDVSNYVLNVSETFAAPDYFQAKKTVSITLYNENGVLDAVLRKQKAVEVSWRWGSDKYVKSFTGMVIDVSTSQRPGMETITINCEDYMFILANTFMINSPFYDGMVMKAALMDLSRRAGITSFIVDWDDVKEYFLPSGFAFTKPKFRFGQKDKVLDSMIKLVKLAEAFIFFDAEGRFHIDKLPGGLYSVPNTQPTANFYQNPEIEQKNQVIVGDKNVSVTYSGTVNTISILSLDRNTRNAMIYTDSAKSRNKLLFKRVFLEDQPALGEMAVVRGRARDLGKRIYSTIKKISFKTAGNPDPGTKPLDFVTVDGQPFRLVSMKKSYIAETNDFMNEYECEWLGGGD